MSNPAIYLVWQQNSNMYVGVQNSIFVQNEASTGITFPDQTTIPVTITLSSSASQQQLLYTFNNVKLYITGPEDEIEIVQDVWPTLGGGLQISYDGGLNYNTFNTEYGYQPFSSTWPTLPASAIGTNGIAGTLRSFDTATLLLKFVIPQTADEYQIYDISLTADFDII